MIDVRAVALERAIGAGNGGAADVRFHDVEVRSGYGLQDGFGDTEGFGANGGRGVRDPIVYVDCRATSSAL